MRPNQWDSTPELQQPKKPPHLLRNTHAVEIATEATLAEPIFALSVNCSWPCCSVKIPTPHSTPPSMETSSLATTVPLNSKLYKRTHSLPTASNLHESRYTHQRWWDRSFQSTNLSTKIKWEFKEHYLHYLLLPHEKSRHIKTMQFTTSDTEM